MTKTDVRHASLKNGENGRIILARSDVLMGLTKRLGEIGPLKGEDSFANVQGKCVLLRISNERERLCPPGMSGESRLSGCQDKSPLVEAG